MANVHDLTAAYGTFREAARHLWNTAFAPTDDWDVRDRYSRVLVELFDALVLAPAGIRGVRHPELWQADPEPIAALEVVPAIEDGTPIMVNRNPPPTEQPCGPGGYWDDPVDRVRPAEVQLQFVRAFDFDELGVRELRYAQVAIAAFPSVPHLVGRRALLEVEHVQIFARG